MSTDIKISQPFQLSLNVIEIEEKHYPSFRTELKCIFPHPTGFYTYEASDIWFECHIWDNFIQQLSVQLKHPNNESILQDMSQYFLLVISNRNDKYKINLKCFEPNTGSGEVTLEYEKIVHKEVIAIIYRECSSFPKWWISS